MIHKKKLNILIAEVSGWGGICHYTFNLCQELARTGLEVVQLSTKENELADHERDFKMIGVFDQQQKYFTKWFLILKYIIISKADVFHMQNLITARKDFLFFMLLKILPVKVVYTAHNVLPHDLHERDAFGMKFVFQCIYRCVDGIITHSERDKAEIASIFTIDPGKIRTIPHGDYNFFQSIPTIGTGDIRRLYSIGEEERVILSFGTIRKYKGLHNLISAFAAIDSKERKNTRLLLIGRMVDEDYFAELQELIRKHYLSDSVILLAEYVPFEEVPIYFEAADLIALPYEHIYDSGVLRLAFSFSKPVIATRVGIFNELLIDGENGFLVGEGIGELTNGLKRFQKMNVDGLRAMGQNSNKFFGEHLKWDKIAFKTLQFYQRVLGLQVREG
jgi:glycosyltransferase involved in cell wall biosynthesis